MTAEDDCCAKLPTTEPQRRLAPTAAQTAQIADSVPMNRLGTPEDIAHVCLFLGSESAAYVNGQVFASDGGWALTGAKRPIASLHSQN